MKKHWAVLTALGVLSAFLPPSPLLAANAGDFAGGVAIGTGYAGIAAAPTDGAIVQGNVGIGTTAPNASLQVGAGVGTAGQSHTTALISNPGPTNFAVFDSTNNVELTNYVGGYDPNFSGDLGVLGTFTNHPLVLRTGNNDRVTIDTSGNMGIGTTSPGGVLDVRGGIAASGPGHPLIIAAQQGSPGNVGGNLILDSGTNGVGAIGNGQIIFSTGGGTINTTPPGSVIDTRMLIDTNGNVGIGTTTPAYLLDVGSPAATGAVAQLQNSSGACTHTPSASSETVSCSSDQRLKADIKDAQSTLPWLADMRVRDFTIKSTGEHKTGVIAQEVMVKHPDMVHKNLAGIYSVDEPNPWVLVKTIQELHQITATQQAEIEALKKTIAAMSEQKIKRPTNDSQQH